jgi:hypothetical protein
LQEYCFISIRLIVVSQFALLLDRIGVDEIEGKDDAEVAEVSMVMY